MHSLGYCQVDEKLDDRPPPRYWVRARREPAMLGIRYGGQPQLDNALLIPVWSKYSNAQRFSSLHLSKGCLNPPSWSDTYSSSAEGVAMDWKTVLSYISGSVDEVCLLFIHPRDGDHGYTQPERVLGGRAVSGRTLQPLGPHRSMTGVDSTSLATSWSVSRYERRTREERHPFEAC